MTIKVTEQPSDLDALLTGLRKSYDEEMARIDRAIDHVDHKENELLAAAADRAEVPFESIARVREREYDDLMAAQKPEEAAQKLKEAEEIKAVLPRLEAAYEDCALERALLEKERKGAVRKVLDAWHPQAIAQIRPDERELYGKLERIETAIREFIDDTDSGPILGRRIGIDPEPYINSLVAKGGEEGEMRRKWHLIVEQIYLRR